MTSKDKNKSVAKELLVTGKKTIIISNKKKNNIGEEETNFDDITTMNIKNLLEKRDKFIFEICESMANTMIDHEVKLYKKIQKSKLSVLKKNNIKKVIVKMLQETFNELYKTLLENKKFNNEYDNIVSYFGHSKLGFIHLIAPKCVQIHVNIERENLDINSEEEYVKTFSTLVNDELNENYYEILEEFICEIEKGTYDDKMLKDEDVIKNIAPFNFAIGDE